LKSTCKRRKGRNLWGQRRSQSTGKSRKIAISHAKEACKKKRRKINMQPQKREKKYVGEKNHEICNGLGKNKLLRVRY
jgi:hypothetical protein